MRPKKHTTNRESGFVSILTVMFFIVLMSVITVGFVRLMVQERQQTLEDELSKSAYNAAMSGVEDAKRAILYCNSLSGAEKAACEASLYNQKCPGFNADDYFEQKLGVPRSINNQTSLVLNETNTAVQGYSCVLVSPQTTTLKGVLTPLSENGGTLLQMSTARPFSKIRIEWHNTATDKQGVPNNYDSNTFTNPSSGGSPRREPYGGWGGRRAGMSTALRIMTLTVPNGAFTLGSLRQYQESYFVYPVGTGTATANILLSYKTRRYETRCYADRSYACAVEISDNNDKVLESSSLFLLLNSIYSNTDYQIKALDAAGNEVPFVGVQTTIDSTGYASGVYRRVQVNVRLGGQSFATSNALDTGLGLCKSFEVGANFINNQLPVADCAPLP